MGAIRINCKNPKCRTALSVPSHLAGQRVRCSCCGQVLRVPARRGRAPSGRRSAA